MIAHWELVGYASPRGRILPQATGRQSLTSKDVRSEGSLARRDLFFGSEVFQTEKKNWYDAHLSEAEHPTDSAARLSDQQTKRSVFGEKTAAFEERRTTSSEVAAESAIALQKVRKS
jgi:hypothetical protein